MREAGSGTDMDLAIDKASTAEYASLLTAHRGSLVDAFEQVGGQYLQMRSDLPAQDMLARLMAAGLIGTYGAMPAQGPGVPL
jgi:NADPH-dependent curcumin reductase CurA